MFALSLPLLYEIGRFADAVQRHGVIGLEYWQKGVGRAILEETRRKGCREAKVVAGVRKRVSLQQVPLIVRIGRHDVAEPVGPKLGWVDGLVEDLTSSLRRR